MGFLFKDTSETLTIMVRKSVFNKLASHQSDKLKAFQYWNTFECQCTYLSKFSDNGPTNHRTTQGRNNPHGGNPHGNPHNGSVYNGPVSLHDLKHGTSKAPEISEHSVRCLLNIENWTAWRLKVYSLPC